MLSRLVEFSLGHRLLVVLATLLLIGSGVYAFQQLPIDAFPDVSPVQVKVIVKAPGMTPEEGRDPSHHADRVGDARHPQQDHASLDD